MSYKHKYPAKYEWGKEIGQAYIRDYRYLPEELAKCVQIFYKILQEDLLYLAGNPQESVIDAIEQNAALHEGILSCFD